jgi:circadian clock protein KaiB
MVMPEVPPEDASKDQCRCQSQPSAPENRVEAFEEALRRLKEEKYVLRLYVAGMSPRSIEAVENTKRFLEENLSGRYELEVIDLYQQPLFAKDGQIVAAPTLIKELPPPLRKLVGSMSNSERILMGLDLHKERK